MKKRVVVNGACGRMGSTVVKTVVEDTENELVGACDIKHVGESIFEIVGIEGSGVKIMDDLGRVITDTEPDVIIDFTTPASVMENVKTALNHGIDLIIGTTGIDEEDQQIIEELARENKAGVLIVPNFAIGAVLLMEFAQKAANYLKDVEIIELHHDQKLDAPSGTAIKTAELIGENLPEAVEKEADSQEKIKGVRGGKKQGIPIHSVRLPGLVAHQEVIFGGEGQTLSLRHDSYNRNSFMPGVRKALEAIDSIEGLFYGLEKVL